MGNDLQVSVIKIKYIKLALMVIGSEQVEFEATLRKKNPLYVAYSIQNLAMCLDSGSSNNMSNKNILHGIFLAGTLFCNYWQSAFVAKLLHSHHLLVVTRILFLWDIWSKQIYENSSA